MNDIRLAGADVVAIGAGIFLGALGVWALVGLWLAL
jgi:hypothetical protein